MLTKKEDTKILSREPFINLITFTLMAQDDNDKRILLLFKKATGTLFFDLSFFCGINFTEEDNKKLAQARRSILFFIQTIKRNADEIIAITHKIGEEDKIGISWFSISYHILKKEGENG